jgi:hypothetical protein
MVRDSGDKGFEQSLSRSSNVVCPSVTHKRLPSNGMHVAAGRLPVNVASSNRSWNKANYLDAWYRELKDIAKGES